MIRALGKLLSRLAPRAVLLGVLVLASGGADALPGESAVRGFWRPPDGGRIEVHACGDRLCAHIRDDGVDNGKPTYDGHLLLEHLVYQGRSTWAEGLIHDPSDNRTYRAKLRLLDGNRLKLTGCAWIFCGSQVWTRIE